MRYAFAVAGLAVAAQAGGNTYTLTATEEVTITSCAPTHTNCPYKSASNDWENWNKPADPTTTWGSWDPSKPSTTAKKSSSTWGDWDPSKPSTTTKPNGGDWNNWDDGSNGKKTTTTTWGSWDPSKPSTTTKPNGGDWNDWNDGSNGKKTTTTSVWGDWDPSKPSSTGWNDWNNGADGKKTTSSKPATATGANGDWNNWGADDSKKTTSGKPATATGANGEWNNWGSASSSKPASNTAACPSYTATAPPAWFSQLPSAVLSSLAAQWTGAPPKDWCYYSYSASSFATKTPDAASSNGEWNNWGSASATSVKGASATGSAPVAKYTGAANANAASFVLGGAAAIAAIVLV